MRPEAAKHREWFDIFSISWSEVFGGWIVPRARKIVAENAGRMRAPECETGKEKQKESGPTSALFGKPRNQMAQKLSALW